MADSWDVRAKRALKKISRIIVGRNSVGHHFSSGLESEHRIDPRRPKSSHASQNKKLQEPALMSSGSWSFQKKVMMGESPTPGVLRYFLDLT
jgi:hypothetical protein